jgi:hypothetical protein
MGFSFTYYNARAAPKDIFEFLTKVKAAHQFNKWKSKRIQAVSLFIQITPMNF